MIDLYYWPTPNGHKITIFLEEAGLPYTIVPVNIGAGEQFKPEFLAISPNNRMPAIVDHAPAGGGAPISVFESGAILLYLAEKTGRFLPARSARPLSRRCNGCSGRWAGSARWPGRTIISRGYAPEKIPYAIDRYVKETNRLYGVLNKRLTDRSSSPATIRSPTWRAIPGSCPHERQGQNLDGVSASQALVRGDPGAARHGARLRKCQGSQSQCVPADERGR